ncbi:uncharacterized protein LOC132259478 [Phlebotomus argentipes]|uniref:uncharacterized protein LOC132259478 n=1 Tax=Phlebotomus argentipes TaxID=94469 RepID=UPI00289308FE|nr:uncharacterized protein LOC132259478 [Phlebotomus argentipes]XP_059613106.1 uncharacterized protein LOC132259478 [Phlebotomus argentipes]
MHGIKRVCIFCMLTTLLPAILIILPLYLRHSRFADVSYSLAESDIVEIKEGISTIFCEQHILRMNTSFHAVQLTHSPEISKKRRKHIRLKKSMTLPDDTLEYWGFFLLKGASVALKVCSRFDGSRILVVKGERNLKTCGLQDHNKNKPNGANLGNGLGTVSVTFETVAEEVHDDLPKSFSSEEAKIEEMARLKEAAEKFIKNHPKSMLAETILELKANHTVRTRRDLVLDRRINHGGTALNYTEEDSDSVSSFENGLLTCYDGQILVSQSFPPSTQCTSVKFLENGTHMVMKHDATADGYYYYIFYSDNDLVSNDINAIFDIHKPTFQYSRREGSRDCVNSTTCVFPIHFFSDETVIVEVPTRDGIEHEDEDFTTLISSCKPRMAVYVIFPIAILFLLVTCSFM